jgi:hypothetical protein
MSVWHFPRFARFVQWFCLGYLIYLLSVRCYLRGPNGLLDFFWGCNFGLAATSYGIAVGSPALVGACFVTVFLAHFVMWVEVALWVFAGMVPTGPAAYLAWPQTTMWEISSTFHHVFYVPFVLIVLYRSGGLSWRTYWISWILTTFLAFAGRFCAPRSVMMHDGAEYYLNVNMGHEVIANSAFPLFVFMHSLPVYLYLPLLIFIGNAFVHGPVFAIMLRPFSKLFLE